MVNAKSLRAQFKASSLKSLKKEADADDKMVGVSSNEYLNLEDGKTLKIRIFPAHPGIPSFYTRKKAYWLNLEGNDGQTYRGQVLDSIIHGGTKMDVVQEYVKMAKKKWANDDEKIEALVGTQMNSNSLNPSYSWICYADKVDGDNTLKAKLWEFKKMVRDGLNRLTFSEDEDDVIETDPFTDPDEGLLVNVTYHKKPNKKRGENFYEVDFGKKAKTRPLTDEELEYFASLKPLNEVLPHYGIDQFERALSGLQIFDDDNEIGLFEDDEWLEKVEEIRAQYDNSDSDNEEPKKKKTAKKVAKKVEEDDDDDDSSDNEEPESEDEEEESSDDDDSEDEDEEESEEDEFESMDRKALKKYIKDNDLDISVKKSMEDDEIREAIRKAVATEDSEEPEEDSDDDDEEDEEPKSKVTLDEIRKRLKK